MGKFKDLTGQKFGRLTVIERAGNDKRCNATWKCVCSCSQKTERIVPGVDLISGHTRSCGCLNSELITLRNLKHGKRGTRLYTIWASMKKRCYNPKDVSYKNYGGRGITVCDEWKNDFKAFYNWAIDNGYKDNLSIDRIYNEKSYFPSNCRFATRKEQNNNQRSNHLITYKGRTQNLKQWADELELNYDTLRHRINTYNWSIEKALNTPVK